MSTTVLSSASPKASTPERPVASSRVLAGARIGAVALGALLVFAAHFRPWEGGLLEEWALARDWQLNGGWRVLYAYVEWTISRPLHLIPTMLGLAISGGSPAGIFVIMGFVAVAQFAGVLWALRTISRSFWLNIAIGLFIALHPLWPAGLLQRFLPAQTAALALIISLGLMVRWLQRGRARWLIGTFVALILGFAVYPGPAIVAPLAALAVALAVPATWKRRVAVVATTTATTGLTTLYSIVIVRLVTPAGQNSYELSNIETSAVSGLRDLFRFVMGTFINYGAPLLLGILAVIVLGALLSLTGAIPNHAGWLMAGVAIVSPACAVVFFGSTAWLQDIDRVGYTTSLTLAVALMIWPITATGKQKRLEAVLLPAMALVAIAGCLVGIRQWQPYVQTQRLLLTALAPVVEEATDEESVVVVDRSGTFGYLYSFPLQYLQGAAYVADRDLSKVWLCFPDAGTFPLPSGGVVCDPTETGLNLRPAGSLAIGGGAVDFYIGKVDSSDFATKEFK